MHVDVLLDPVVTSDAAPRFAGDDDRVRHVDAVELKDTGGAR